MKVQQTVAEGAEVASGTIAVVFLFLFVLFLAGVLVNAVGPF